MPTESDVPNVFLSWSGTKSKQVATLLRDWLPNIVRNAVPWMSSEDIAKGTVWPAELNTSMANCNVSIVVLTRENQAAPWVLFESGAIFKAMQGRHVCTFLCDFEPPITGPLGQFQATLPTESDMRKLCRDIDLALGGKSQERLETWFGKFWGDFKDGFAKVPAAAKQHDPRPSDRDLLEEILATVRATQREIGPPLDTRKMNLMLIIPTYPNSIERILVGDVVEHSQFGMGEVEEISGLQDSDPRATVRFERSGRRTLVLSLARLKLVRRAGGLPN